MYSKFEYGDWQLAPKFCIAFSSVSRYSFCLGRRKG